MKSLIPPTLLIASIITLSILLNTPTPSPQPITTPPTHQTQTPPVRTPLPTPPPSPQIAPIWHQATTLQELDSIAQSLAEQNTPEAIQTLLTGIDQVQDWSTRAALAKNLRAVSNPETLQVLLPALLNNYGRGNTILNEISDTIARLAQPETVEDLAALHWQASVQAGQGHKVLRTVASIRNPIAARGLMKVANHTESPALAAAATEALKAIDHPTF